MQYCQRKQWKLYFCWDRNNEFAGGCWNQQKKNCRGIGADWDFSIND